VNQIRLSHRDGRDPSLAGDRVAAGDNDGAARPRRCSVPGLLSDWHLGSRPRHLLCARKASPAAAGEVVSCRKLLIEDARHLGENTTRRRYRREDGDER
jgi:hypothetical protein